ncbi:unnamed protein product [Heterobilharzia americana]|nr:unnamed protein product [Heterobilharzia americana]
MKALNSLGRLTRLRDLLKARQLQAYILPTEDEHFNEYVSDADQRCAFISGFTGSSCSIVITLDKAALWTDGRYQLQASNELDENWTLFRNDLSESPTKAKWIVSSTPPGSYIGYDGRQIPYTGIETIQKELTNAEAEIGILPICSGNKNSQSRQLIDIPNINLIDLVWQSMSELQIENVHRPIRLSNPLIFIPQSFTGSSFQQKINCVRNIMQMKGAQMLILTALDEIAWLFNLRGSDIRYNPVFFAYVILSMNKVDLFLNSKTVSQTQGLQDYLKDDECEVNIHEYSEFFNYLEMIVQNTMEKQQPPSLSPPPPPPPRIWLDLIASQAIVSRIPENQRLIDISPVNEMKSIKSLSELNGIREIHITDSLVLCDFLAWLEDEANKTTTLLLLRVPMKDKNGAGLPILKPPAILTETSAAKYLDDMRSQAKDFVSLSFSTISCVDANGAIVHYHPVEGQDLPITKSSIYLVDSGGQYLTGTTDVTRTIHLNEPTLEEKNCYTAVLKAHISLAMQASFSLIISNNLSYLCSTVIKPTVCISNSSMVFGDILPLPACTEPYAFQVAGHSRENSGNFEILRDKSRPFVYKSLQDCSRGMREVIFYERVFSPDAPEAFKLLRHYIPTYHGIFQCPSTKAYYIGLSDLVASFKQPNVCDFKMGTVTYFPGSPEDKIAREQFKYAWRRKLGFLLSGMQVYDTRTHCSVKVPKSFGRSLTPEQVYSVG